MKTFEKYGRVATDGNATRRCSGSHDTRRALELSESIALKRWIGGTARPPLRLLAFLMMTGDNVCDQKSRVLAQVVCILATTRCMGVAMLFRSRAARCGEDNT
jgi:hypothetical protein